MRLISCIRPSPEQVSGLTLLEVRGHPDGAAALDELASTYAISEASGGLLLRQKDAECRLFFYNLQAVLMAARRNVEQRERRQQRELEERAAASGRRYRAEDMVPGEFDLASARQVITNLEERIDRLQAIRKEISDQREHWRLRAERAETRLTAPEPAGPEERDDRYRALRRFLAKRFHPDQAPGSGLEKVVRSEMFKEIWAEIERIDTLDR